MEFLSLEASWCNTKKQLLPNRDGSKAGYPQKLARRFKHIQEVSRFEESDRKHIFSMIGAFVAKRKIQSIL